MKKGNYESDFWKSGKHAYDDKNLKGELIYLTNNRAYIKSKKYNNLIFFNIYLETILNPKNTT